MNPRITILGGISLILASIPTAAIQLEVTYATALAGSSVLAYVGTSKLLNRKILEESEGRRTKAFQDLIETVSIFLVIGSAGLTRIVPTWLAVTTIALLGATKVFQLQMSKRYRENFQFSIGQDYWLLIAALIFLGASINSYFLFYGLIVLSLILFYDLGSLVRELER